MNSGDTAFVLLAAALVFLMTPGLAFFYGGLVRRKNILSIMMQCFAVIGIVSIQWVLIGYSLAFSPQESIAGLLGNLQWLGLHGVGIDVFADYSATIPHQAFMIFQMMFAIITPALIVGAVAERMKFSAFIIFTVIWTTIVYDPIAHWVWGVGGWLRNMGALDFAGGTVVHISSGVSALAAAIVLGRRNHMKGAHPCNLPLAVLGAGLLWFGWFGFNAGSALAANGLAASAFVVTHIATAAAALVYPILEWITQKKPTMLGTITGAVAGLVAITPAAGFVDPLSSIAIGGVASIVCFVMIVYVKPFFGYDDTLDAFGVHGMGGIWGALATGLFASKAVNAAGNDGLFFGNAHQFVTQAIAVGATVLYAFVVTFIVLKVLDLVMGIRVTDKEEELGLDLALHNETAYKLLD